MFWKIYSVNLELDEKNAKVYKNQDKTSVPYSD